jgi:hypothetical protein
MSFWEEKIIELQQQPLPQPAPQIPQTSPPSDDNLAGLIAQAKTATAQMTPAQSVAERFGQAPGAEIGTTSRRPGPTAAPEESLLDLTPQQRQELVRLGTAAGKFDENGTAKAAHENAAMVADATRQGAWTTDEDRTPGRWVNPRGVRGYTAGHQGR